MRWVRARQGRGAMVIITCGGLDEALATCHCCQLWRDGGGGTEVGGKDKVGVTAQYT